MKKLIEMAKNTFAKTNVKSLVIIFFIICAFSGTGFFTYKIMKPGTSGVKSADSGANTEAGKEVKSAEVSQDTQKAEEGKVVSETTSNGTQNNSQGSASSSTTDSENPTNTDTAAVIKPPSTGSNTVPTPYVTPTTPKPPVTPPAPTCDTSKAEYYKSVYDSENRTAGNNYTQESDALGNSIAQSGISGGMANQRWAALSAKYATIFNDITARYNYNLSLIHCP